MRRGAARVADRRPRLLLWRLLQEHLDELPWLVRVTAAHAQYVMFGSVGILCLMSVVLLAQMAPHAAVWRQEREEAEREERAKKEG